MSRCLAPAPLGQHSSEVDSLFEAMLRQVLTAQLIVDKHRAMVLANVTFKALAAMASSRGHAEHQVLYTRNYGHYKNVETVLSTSNRTENVGIMLVY